jgi:RNA polymerase sigma factor (sigma-70 family)
MQSTDQELIERTRRGESDAFGELWVRHEPKVLALCRRFLLSSSRDPAVDEHDLAADAFVRALIRLERYQDRTTEGVLFESWLLQVTRRICLNHLASQRRRQQWSAVPLDHCPELLDSAPNAERVVVDRELLRLAALEVNALPERYGAPFRLLLQEYSQKEIGAALGISAAAAAKRVQRARKQLQVRLGSLFERPSSPDSSDRRLTLRGVEQALTEIVTDHRIVRITLPSGGEMQLCLRVDPRAARREPEIDALRARLHDRPRAWKSRLELADLCYHSGHWEAAREEYRRVLAANPACFAAALRLGDMLRQEERRQEAALVYTDALRREPPPTLAARVRAELLAVEGRYEEAVEAFRRAIALAPREKACYYGLNRALGRLSRYVEQLENLARLREIDPDDPYALEAVYTPCARLRRFEMALPLLERAVSADPHHPMALKHLVQVRMNLGFRDAVTQQLAERLVRLAPEFVDSWSELAWVYAELGHDDASVAVLQRFLEEHPHNAEGHAALAWRYHYLSRCEEEITHARRAYVLAPQNSHVCWTLLAACTVPSPFVAESEVERYTEEIAARFPSDSALLQAVSAVYCERRREAEAVAFARRAAGLSPASVEAQAHLGSVYRIFRRWRSAARLYEELVQTQGCRTAGILSDWGRVMSALNDPRAEELLAEASGLARNYRDHLMVALSCQECGKREQAIAAFLTCLSESPLPTCVRRRAEDGLTRLGIATPAG